MILENIHTPADVKALDREQLEPLCRELRQFLVEHVSKTGGHLASNLGAVELTVAIHRVFDTSKDRLVFDVGHQCYVHKALTGRQALFDTLRQFGGLSGFPQAPGERTRRLHRRTCLQLRLRGPWDGKSKNFTALGLQCSGADRGRRPDRGTGL